MTADGQERTVIPEQLPELFWALRGGGGDLAAVTAIEIELLPVSEIYGGGLFFSADRTPVAIEAFRPARSTAPPELSLSLALVAFPDLPALPPPLRGQFCCSCPWLTWERAPEATALSPRCERAEPLLDTVAVLPMTEVGSIHADPAGPMPVNGNSVALGGDDVLDDLLALVQPNAPFLLEVRHLGGALAHPQGPRRPSVTEERY